MLARLERGERASPGVPAYVPVPTTRPASMTTIWSVPRTAHAVSD